MKKKKENLGKIIKEIIFFILKIIAINIYLYMCDCDCVCV